VRINLGKKDFALAASAILATYSADGSTLWIGQMNQIWAGTIALGSLILFFESFATNRTFRFRRVTIGLALCLQFLAIWSYDTIAAALMISSTGLLLIKRLSNWKLWSLYQILPVTYLIQFLSHMMKQGDEYRNSLISNETSINGILDNVMWMFGASLTGVVNSQNLTNIAFVVLGIFVTFTLVTTSRRRFQNIGNAEIYILFWLNRYSFKSFITLVLIAASLFAPFALLQDARSLWRTHLLAPLPLSILLAGSVFLFSNLFPRVSRDWVKITLTLLIVVPFLINQVERGEFHREIWKIHSSTLVKLDEKLSCGIPEDGLILVLKPDSSTDGNVRSPFGHNYWLKEAIKLRYSVRSIPPVAYVSTTGVLGPGVSFEDFEGNVPTLIHLDQEATDTLETLLRNKLASSGIKTVEYACSRNNIPVRIRWVS